MALLHSELGSEELFLCLEIDNLEETNALVDRVILICKVLAVKLHNCLMILLDNKIVASI